MAASRWDRALCTAPSKRLLAARLIEESDERPDPDMDDERRRYYRLTALGQRVAQAEASRYAEMVKLARGKRLFARPIKTVREVTV